METTSFTQFGDIESFLHDSKMNGNIYEVPPQKPSTPPSDTFDDAHRTSNTDFLPSHCALQNGLACSQSGHQKRMQEVVLAPFKYIESLPSKGVRNILIDALNVWFKVPDVSFNIIREVVALLHTSSLMFDDIEDGSALRRGKPATHKVFGIAQTINSSTYVLMSSIVKARGLYNPDCSKILVDGVYTMLEGQGMDLHSTYLMECPQENEYLEMVDRKTGGLFRIAYRLMRAESMEKSIPDLDTIMTILGRYFQIRDDYMNLESAEYTGQKGFCEDLDEGKFSFPLIHCLGGTSSLPPSMPHSLELKNIFASRARLDGFGLSPEVKWHILDILRNAGSLESTKLALNQLERGLRTELDLVEGLTGVKNMVLRGLIDKMHI
ncbi:isoprenoid synthase domain-containing protein [Amylocarpus encephaloides]|uniref:Isoprenoid synthase domain-containing protein n=1 Tax=Amylocarpus encephaloides TaxID=45428 RepID=A0A9P7YA02_9HELO|nr:isoprenoid synthase domain-containing protein [Amylocarpus encephaloides]